MRIFSDEKLCGADLAPENDVRILMCMANKSMNSSTIFDQETHYSAFAQMQSLLACSDY